MNTIASAIQTPTQSSKRDWLKWAGSAALAPALAAAAPDPSTAGPRAGYFPNTLVQTHDGRSLRFYDDVLRGKIVVFNMMYAVCTGLCPGNTANLREVQKGLSGRLGKDIFMVSMTLQPQFDTPSALQAYVRRYDIQPGWLFITGQPKEMDVIRRRLGFFNDDPKLDSDLANHTGMVRIGNESLDRWFTMPALSRPQQIARAVLQL